MTDHPFKEYHDDCEIGNLMWRLDRRGDQLSFSQDGSEIHELERAQIADRKKLHELKDAYDKECQE